MNLEGETLRAAIDEAIAEIDRVEGEMLELFAELLGPEAAVQLASYTRAAEDQSRLAALAKATESQRTPVAEPSPGR